MMTATKTRLRAAFKSDLLVIFMEVLEEPVGKSVIFDGPKHIFLNVAYKVLAANGIEDISILSTVNPQEVYIVQTTEDSEDGE